jgi:hypothetical protein
MHIYKKYERMSQDAIMTHFGLPLEEPLEVKAADDRLLITEQRDLMPHGGGAGNTQEERRVGIVPLPEKIVPWTTERAEKIFLERFYELNPNYQRS